MTRRSSLRTLALTLAVSLSVAAAAHAQSPAPPPAPPADSAAARDSVPHRLTPVVITAAPHQSLPSRIWQALGERAEFTALLRDDKALARQLRSYDQEVARLESRLAALRARPDSLRRDITMLDRVTAATRAERARLEARLRIVARASVPVIDP